MNPLTSLSDEHLVRLTREGDIDASRALIARYIHRVRAYLAKSLRDYELAQDLAQDVFVRALANLPTYTGRGDFEAWLFTIARNTASNYRRGLHPEPTDPHLLGGDAFPSRRLESMPDPAQLALDAATAREIFGRLAQLPALHCQVLVFRYVFGLNSVEVAEIVGKKPAAVRQLHHRALVALRKGLG